MEIREALLKVVYRDRGKGLTSAEYRGLEFQVEKEDVLPYPTQQQVAAEAEKWHYNGVNGSRAFLAGMKYLKDNPGAAV